MPTDEEVAARVLAGEADLFELLMRRHNPRVYRAIRSVLHDDAEVEEAMQQAYLQAWRHLGEFSGRSNLSTWLVRIAVNEALMRARRTGRLTIVPDPEQFEEATMSAQATASPEARAQARELTALMEQAVDSLPQIYRTVFVLRDIEELSTSEAAEALAVSEDVVKTRLHRARGLLRDALLEQVAGNADALFPFHASRCDRVVRGVLAQLQR